MLQRELPAGLSPQEVSRFFQQQEEAAFKPSDSIAREKVLRQWVRAQPDNSSPRWNLEISKSQAAARTRREVLPRLLRVTSPPM